MLTFEQLARAATGGGDGAAANALAGPERWQLTGLTTDSRAVSAGDVFVALEGENFDGNDFIDAAIAGGASVVVCGEGRTLDRRDVVFIETADTLRALGDIAAAHRRTFDIAVVAITGSNGKTTTKELLRSICAVAHGDQRVLANVGNLNNLIGLPLTVMQLRPVHAVAILEMGMNAPGEIARLTEIARPTAGAITCVASAHLEGLGSLEGVAAAKGELFAGLGDDATAVVNLDDERVVGEARRLGKTGTVRFGTGGEVRAENVRAAALDCMSFDLVYGDAAFAVELPMAGRHNVANAVAAAACAYALGLPADIVARGLATVSPPPMRVAVEELANGARVVNDAYNANPDSLRAALATLDEAAAGRKLLALGEMLELGERAAELHREAGRAAATLHPVLVCALGAHAPEVCAGAREAGLGVDATVAADGHEQAARAIAEVWQPGDTILVKGSRGSRMECVVEELRRLAVP